MTFSDSDATRIIAALEARAEKKTRNGAQVQTTWGTIGAVDTAQKFASAYLYGETDGAYMSEGFRIPETMYLTVGDKVKVAINYATGERWVEEKNVSSVYKKVAIDSDAGSIVFGAGDVAPSLSISSVAIGTGKFLTASQFKVLSGRGYQTSNTVTADVNKWTKIASGSMPAQYRNVAFTLLFGGNGSGSAVWQRGLLTCRIKQQNPFGNQPFVSLELVNGRDILPDDFSLVVTSVAGPTTWELYARITSTYCEIHFQPLYLDDGATTITFYETDGWAASLPAGTVYTATDAITLSDTLILANTTDVSLTSTGHAFQIGPSSGSNIAMDGNEIMARNNGAASALFLQADGGDVYIGGTATSGFLFRGAGSMELTADAGTPYIDFKNATADDFDVRLILAGDDRLDVTGGSLNITTAGASLMWNGTQVVGSRKTGWGAPTGTATRTTFATDTVTLIELARRVKALVDDLTTHGLIGA